MRRIYESSVRQSSQRKSEYSYGCRVPAIRKVFSMNTKSLAVISVIGVAVLSVSQASAQAPRAPDTFSPGRTMEKATNPQAPGGGAGWYGLIPRQAFTTGNARLLRHHGEGEIHDRAGRNSGGIQTRTKELIPRHSFKEGRVLCGL